MTITRRTSRLLVAAFALFFGLGIEPCEDSASDSSRIVSAGGSITEILYFLGLSDKLIGVDSTSNYPPEAAEFPVVGYVRQLSTEGLLSLAPTLILGENDMGPPTVLKQLESTGVETIVVPEIHNAQGIVDKIVCVATVVGEADSFSTQMRDELALLLNELDSFRQAETSPRAGFILSLTEGSLLASGGGTSAAGFLDMIGAENVFAEFDGWKSVSKESLIRVNPDFLIFTDRAINTFDDENAIREHDAVSITNAAKHDGIIVRDGMSMLGYGPRTLSVAVDVARSIHGDSTDE